MFPARYFSPSYWAARFWAKVGSTSITVAVDAATRIFRPAAEVRTFTPPAGDATTTADWPFDSAVFDPDVFATSTTIDSARIFRPPAESRTGRWPT